MAENRPVKVWLNYHGDDKKFFIELCSHLRPLEREGLVNLRHDALFLGGDNEDIEAEMDQAEVILLLLSSSCFTLEQPGEGKNEYEKQIEKAMQLSEEKRVRLVPILARPFLWDLLRLARLPRVRMLPTRTGRPEAISSSVWGNQDEAWTTLTREILTTIETIIETKERESLPARPVAAAPRRKLTRADILRDLRPGARLVVENVVDQLTKQPGFRQESRPGSLAIVLDVPQNSRPISLFNITSSGWLLTGIDWIKDQLKGAVGEDKAEILATNWQRKFLMATRGSTDNGKGWLARADLDQVTDSGKDLLKEALRFRVEVLKHQGLAK